MDPGQEVQKDLTVPGTRSAVSPVSDSELVHLLSIDIPALFSPLQTNSLQISPLVYTANEFNY